MNPHPQNQSIFVDREAFTFKPSLSGFRAASAIVQSETLDAPCMNHSLPGFRALKWTIWVIEMVPRSTPIHFRASGLSGHFGRKFLYIENLSQAWEFLYSGKSSVAGRCRGLVFLDFTICPPGSLESLEAWK